jgi:hypothetical protein
MEGTVKTSVLFEIFKMLDELRKEGGLPTKADTVLAVCVAMARKELQGQGHRLTAFAPRRKRADRSTGATFAVEAAVSPGAPTAKRGSGA